VSYEPVHSAGANTGRIAVPRGFVEKSKFRCLVPQCRGRSFNHKRDLKRHEKRHNSNAKLWYCGCCQNSGDPYRGQVRKDKVQDHLRRKHDKSQSGDNKGIPCLVEGCFMLFTTGSCLHTHLRQEHPNEQGDRRTQTNNGKYILCRRN